MPLLMWQCATTTAGMVLVVIFYISLSRCYISVSKILDGTLLSVVTAASITKRILLSLYFMIVSGQFAFIVYRVWDCWVPQYDNVTDFWNFHIDPRYEIHTICNWFIFQSPYIVFNVSVTWLSWILYIQIPNDQSFQRACKRIQ